MRYKAILLDLDNTLYPYNINHKAAIKEVIVFCSNNFNISDKEAEDTFYKARKEIAKAIPFTASSHNRLLYFQKLCELLNKKASLYAFKLYNIYWDVFLKGIKLSDGILHFLDKCQKNNIKIVLVTDLTAHIQYRKIEKLKIGSYLDFITTSEEIGFDKPHKLIFLNSLEKLNLQKSEVCMIGDSYDKDIIGANSLNIDSYWLNNDKNFKDKKNIKQFTTFTQLANMIFK